MPAANNIIFCMRASNRDNEGLNAYSILSALTPDYIPGLFSFSVVSTVLDVDPKKNHILRVAFVNEDGSEVIDASMEIKAPEILGDSNLPEKYRGLNLAMDWSNVDFKAPGLHTLTIYIDEEEVGKKEIYVKGKNE